MAVSPRWKVTLLGRGRNTGTSGSSVTPFSVKAATTGQGNCLFTPFTRNTRVPHMNYKQTNNIYMYKEFSFGVHSKVEAR